MLAPTRPASASPVLEHHRLADEGADEVKRDGAGERVGGLEGQYDAGEGRDEQGHGERVDADAPHLDEGEPSPRRDVGEGAPQVRHELAPAADGLDEVDGLAADPVDHGP